MQAIWRMRKSVFIQTKDTVKMQAIWKRRKSVFKQKQYLFFFASKFELKWAPEGCSDVGVLFINEEQKIFGLWHI